MKKLKGIVAALLLAATASSAHAETFIGGRTDFRDETIYFAMTTRFYDGDPSNNVCSWDKQDVQKSKNDPDWRGDFKGLIDKLDYIKALGFTAIWITPIVQNASGEDYHGYHAMDFKNVDLRLESRKDWGASEDVRFDSLINKAHKKGLKIVLDIVLQHTGNFGEVNLNPLFTRDQNIKSQANVAASLIPNPDRFSADYFEQDGTAQYAERWKYFKNPQYEPHNYYHHYGTGWNWDLPNRWWGQIAGDCVDLNTENDHVAQYIVDCYGEFIKMGVDAFRIDTSGHISPLTFNKQFIPQFHAIAEEYKHKRLNECPFYMFGEVCQRFQGSVVYRDIPNLSSYFYTWKSSQALLNQFNGDPSWWDAQVLPEGHDTPVGPMAVCEQDTQDKPRSNNAWLQNSRWHEPDYSQASGFNVIDFPLHYSFSNVGNIIGLTRMDNYYNDATYNVVYVDSHDYCPGPNDGTRFNGGTQQWAENLSFMFTFRGIPCIYYGSEVEFKKGLPIDVGGESNKTPRSQSGRAYFGTYLEGSVEASDFGKYTASGNVAQTLNADLAQHIRRLNQIRAAVPALRKGQYTYDGCSANGGWAFKRGYKNESYACVAVNGGATFSNLPAGTYTEIVTGKKYNVAEGGSLTLEASKTKGQLRVAVRNWNGPTDIVGEDGKFIYANSPVAHGGSVEFEDPGTPHYYTSEDAPERPIVKFNPAGGSFKTETLTVTATLSESATSGWFQINGGSKFNLTSGQSKDFTIGEGMGFGETVSVSWSASDGSLEMNGKVTYKKVDPNAVTTIFVTGKDGADISGTHLYAWKGETKLNGAWPGAVMTDKVTVDNREFFTCTLDTSDKVNIIFSKNGQTGNIEGVEGNAYFEYDGSTNATRIEVNEGPQPPMVSANPASGTSFTESLKVVLTASPSADIFYTVNGSQANASSTKYSGPITITETTTINTYTKNDAGEKRQSFTYTKVPYIEPSNDHTVYFLNSGNWNDVYVYCWDNNHKESNSFSGAWPGKKLTETVTLSNVHPDVDGKPLYKYTFSEENDLANPQIIFNNNSGGQTADLKFMDNGIYRHDMSQGAEPFAFFTTGVSSIKSNPGIKVYLENGKLVIDADNSCVIPAARLDGTVHQLTLKEGLNYFELPKGFYIIAGKKVII
ncbi:MAG: starch-binding protein [Muribaculaceae bacterium]|nr:starch-binding protein [Muribaculaceae bacterium]